MGLEDKFGAFLTSNKLKGIAYDMIRKKFHNMHEFMRMSQNGAFGEIALINDTPRGASIV